MQQIGKYKVIKELGAGGFGAVYLAEDPKLHTQVAIKVFQVKDANVAGQATSSTSDAVGVLTERFINEAKTLRKLSSNPYIVDMYEFDELDDGTPYYIMPYLSRSLVDVMGKDAFTVGAIEELTADQHPKAIASAQAIIYLKQLLDALAEVHRSDLVHRDIKPANILLNNKSQVQLCDFGIAKLPDAEHSQSGLGMGSRNYMSPEQRDSAKHVTAASDIYSVGVLAYRMLTGQLPLGRFQDPIHFAPSIGEQINTLILQAIEQQPELRPADAGIMLAALKKAEKQTQSALSNQQEEETGTWVEDNTAAIKPELKPLQQKISDILLREGDIPKQDYFQLEALAAIAGLDKAELEAFIDQITEQLTPKLKPLQNWLALAINKIKAGELDDNVSNILISAAKSVGLDEQQAQAKIDKLQQQHQPTKSAPQPQKTESKAEATAAKTAAPSAKPKTPSPTQESTASSTKNWIVGLIVLVLGIAGYWGYDNYQQGVEKQQKAEVAKQRLIELEQKQHDDAWQLAQADNTAESYQVYLDNWPRGQYREQAKAAQVKIEHAIAAQEKIKNSVIPLTITTSPSNAEVKILNIGPRYQDRIKLPAGDYQINVSQSGYESQTQWITLNKANQTHHITLVKKVAQHSQVAQHSEEDVNAVKRYLAAAEQGDAQGQFNLGVMYANGEGIAQDDQQAVAWYRKSAEQGYAAAQYYLGARYDNGRGVTQNDQQAVAWYRKAAEQGHASAQTNLGVMYSSGQGVTQDHQQALAWYRKAAEQGHAKAQFNLGVRYDNGQGVAEDNKQAVVWYRKAAEQGNASAQTNLGVMYEYGEGIAKDEQQAVAWYLKAAEQGKPSAQTNLGNMYEDGKGVAQDKQQAVAWYSKAAGQDYERAIKALKRLNQ